MTYARGFQYKQPLPGVVATAGNWSFDDDVHSAAISAPSVPNRDLEEIVALTYAQHARRTELWSFGRPAVAVGFAAPLGNLGGLQPLLHAIEAERNAEFNIGAVIEAIRLLDLIHASVARLPAPEIGVGEMETSIGWTKGDQIVLISIEGDGEPAYAYQVNGKFTPGKEQFLLSTRRIPADLRDYLQAMYA